MYFLKLYTAEHTDLKALRKKSSKALSYLETEQKTTELGFFSGQAFMTRMREAFSGISLLNSLKSLCFEQSIKATQTNLKHENLFDMFFCYELLVFVTSLMLNMQLFQLI